MTALTLALTFAAVLMNELRPLGPRVLAGFTAGSIGGLFIGGTLL